MVWVHTYVRTFHEMKGAVRWPTIPPCPRSLQPSSPTATKKHKIHVLDPAGLQDISLSEHRATATFDELCDNYAMERLQMLFHDSTFTAEQERYIQEEIQYSFSDAVSSPLPVIDVIDRNVPMVSGGKRVCLCVCVCARVCVCVCECVCIVRMCMYVVVLDAESE